MESFFFLLPLLIILLAALVMLLPPEEHRGKALITFIIQIGLYYASVWFIFKFGMGEAVSQSKLYLNQKQIISDLTFLFSNLYFHMVIIGIAVSFSSVGTFLALRIWELKDELKERVM